MRPVTMLMLAVVFAFAGTAAMAADACNPCGPSTTTCPPVACQPAAVCPPVAECPPPAPVCPPIPAAVGAGPMPAITSVTCPEDFDKTFIQAVYQNNADIIALATLGMQQACDRQLRNLSGKIRHERTQHNQKLVQFARMVGNCDLNLVCNTCITDQLTTLVGQDFDIRYSILMIGLLMQAQDAARVGMTQSCIADLRNQNRISFRAAENEIAALQNWLMRAGIANTPGVVGGAGPVCATIPPPTPCPAPCPTVAPVCPAPCPPAAGPVCPEPCPTPAATPPVVCPAPCP